MEVALGFLDRSAIVAPPGWGRWLVPPAALAVHLSIGQAYAWSNLKTGLGTGAGNLGYSGVATALPFQLAIVMLGLSAAFGGTTVERRGPRWAMLVSTIFFSGGFLISALGMALSQYWLVVIGYGFFGGIGLGIGYISPVSTLMKWFSDRPGMATGIAIMGFGGGALIAAPIETALMATFGRDYGGFSLTFLVMGVGYAIFMSMGWLLVRVPADDWAPPDTPRPTAQASGTTTGPAGPAVSAATAIRLPQFWFLWIVLCFNVTAGIGLLERANPIYRDFFATTAPSTQIAAAAGAFVSILSLANMLGRFVWSSASDVIGRKNIYRLYLGVGALLYLVILTLGEGNKVVFLVAALLILSFYGAGFATIPAYLKDLFGTYQVGAIHGRLLTAWSAAGVLGPLVVNAIVDAQGDVPGPGKYSVSFMIMIGLLVVGFIANELVRPVDPRFYESTATPVREEEAAR
ncbi:MFS transporter [Actinomycetospora chiangmaiensis]|uniref:OFA family MFS transporter n=1 Tax=Actinomycetospora chiangmaiensis TaxID=402650 RepID=UPI00036843D9